MRWVGGINAPGLGGWRINASWPFGVLLLSDGQVTVKLRWVGRVLGTTALVCQPRDLALAFPCDGRFSQGVGLRTNAGAEIYFWTGQRVEVLSQMARLGFSTGNERQRARSIR